MEFKSENRNAIAGQQEERAKQVMDNSEIAYQAAAEGMGHSFAAVKTVAKADCVCPIIQ